MNLSCLSRICSEKNKGASPAGAGSAAGFGTGLSVAGLTENPDGFFQ